MPYQRISVDDAFLFCLVLSYQRLGQKKYYSDLHMYLTHLYDIDPRTKLGRMDGNKQGFIARKNYRVTLFNEPIKLQP